MPHADRLAEQHLPHLHLRACALIKEPDLHAFVNSLPAAALSPEESATMLERFGEYYRNHEPELMRQMEVHQRQIRRLHNRERLTETLNMGVQSYVISFTLRSLRDVLITLKVPVKDVDFALNALLYLLMTLNCEGNYTNLAMYFLLEKMVDRTFDSKLANIIKFSFAIGLECHNLVSAKSSVQGLINLATNTFFAYAGAKISRFLTTIYNPAIEEMDRVEPPQNTRVLLLVHN